MIEKMKVVHIVTTAAEKTALLDRLQQLGIVHFSEKASADQQHLQRFADLSRMVTVLQEYGNVPPEKVPLSNDEFESFFSELSACMERKKALQEEQTAAHAAAERLAEWGRFSPTDLRSLKDAGWDIHIYRTDKKTMAALLNAPDVQIIRCENTAAAAKFVAESGRNDVAALASRTCGALYGLAALAECVQDQGNNYTRFICISKNLEIYPGADRTSLRMVLAHKPGALYQVLSLFNALGINLNKLESRPIPERDFEFAFYFDLDTSIYSPDFLQLMAELPGICEQFSYLGSYSEVI